MILALRTDKPEAELYLYSSSAKVDSYNWQAHRELSDTLLIKIEQLLRSNGATIQDLTGVCIYQGPGSFTGLRIGISIANSLAYSLSIPIVGATDENWLRDSLQNLPMQTVPQIITPLYGSEPNITEPKK